MGHLITDATDHELEAYRRAIVAEQERRRTLAEAPGKLDQIGRDVLAAEGITEGAEWQPGRAYPAGWRVTHEDRGFTSQISNNVWPPGDPNDPQTVRWWKPDPAPVPEDGVPVWGPGLAVQRGDQYRYEPDGRVYEVLQAHTTQVDWTPPAVPALWKEVGS